MGMQARAVNPAFEIDGVWIEYDGYRVKVARSGGSNKKYLKMLEEKTRPISRAIELRMVSEEKMSALLKEVFAKTVILGWQVGGGGVWLDGIEDIKGSSKTVEFDYENVMEVITDPRFNDVWLDIQSAAGNASNYLETMKENDAKN